MRLGTDGPHRRRRPLHRGMGRAYPRPAREGVPRAWRWRGPVMLYGAVLTVFAVVVVVAVWRWLPVVGP